MLSILILTDGKIGDLVQCRGVAQAISGEKTVTEKVVAAGGFWSLPLPLMPVRPSERRGKPDSPFNGVLPDLILASGRRTVPHLRVFKRLRRGNGRPVIVFLKDPRMGRSASDFVWAPVHDRLSGQDVISTHTSPHTLSAETLADAALSAKERFAAYGGQTTGIILGGDSGAVKWDEKSAGDFADLIARLPGGDAFLVTPSRRTPDCLSKAVQAVVSAKKGWYWDGSGDNPYPQILAHASRLIVTGDSHNMVSECLASGSPVFVYRPPGLQSKLVAFLDAMERSGAVHSLQSYGSVTASVKLDATLEIARAIEKRLST